MIVDEFGGESALHRLKLGENKPEDILKLYQSNVYYAKISNRYPQKMENVIKDLETVPEITDADHKFYVSIYNSRQLLAVLVFIDGYKALRLGVIRENKPAMSFWNKQGFRIIAENDNGEYDLFVMEKML